MNDTVEFEIRDYNRSFIVSSYNLPLGTSPTTPEYEDFRDALLGASHGYCFAIKFITPLQEDDGSLGETGPVATVDDLGVFTFQCDDGTNFNVGVPAPREVVFGPGSIIDETNTLSATLIAAVLALPLLNGNGSPLVEFVSGFRVNLGDE